MTLPLPSVFHPQLTVERLQAVSDWLLDEFFTTQDDLVRSTDTPYTRGCTTFGRQRSRLIAEWRSRQHPWLDMLDPGNAVVFSIGGVACRFSNDDPDNPSKSAVLDANPYQETFAGFASSDRPEKFCFVVDRGFDGLADPHVVFLGLSADNTVLCRWASDAVPAFRDEFRDQPSAVDVPKAPLSPKKPEADDDDQQAASREDAPEQP